MPGSLISSPLLLLIFTLVATSSLPVLGESCSTTDPCGTISDSGIEDPTASADYEETYDSSPICNPDPFADEVFELACPSSQDLLTATTTSTDSTSTTDSTTLVSTTSTTVTTTDSTVDLTTLTDSITPISTTSVEPMPSP